MSRITHSQHFAAGGDGPLEEVVAACLESSWDEIDVVLERACLEHPRMAGEIRRRISRLREVGLLREPQAAEAERFPEQLGEFRLLERLGGGGMGVVFRARQEALRRDVALKLIRPEHLYLPLARERFRRESEATARLAHTGIVPIYTVGEADGLPFYAMELVGGATLTEALRDLCVQNPERLQGEDLALALGNCARPWANWDASIAATAFAGSYVENVVKLVIQVAESLQHAHSRGVLHRDVKPSNVAVTHDARAHLFDFGLASLGDASERLTKTRAELGSLPYMSPEQLRGPRENVDARSDIYALGVSLYELLALKLPFAETDPLEARRAIVEGSVWPLRAINRAVPRDLETVCAKAMERDAKRRYQDAAALARDLRNVLEKRPVEARPAGAVLQVQRWVQRHPIATTLLAALVALPTAMLWQKSTHAHELGVALDSAEHERKIAQDQRKVVQDRMRDMEVMNEFLVDLFDAVDPSRAQGRELTARDVLDEGARKLETELTDQPLARASLFNSLGESYAGLGEFAVAEDMLKRGLALREETLGSESLEVAESLRELSALENLLGRPTAIEHAGRALELYRRLAPARDYELADSLVTYGIMLVAAGRLDEAGAVYEEALEIQRILPGDQRDLRGTVLTHQASLSVKRGRSEDALAAAREAIEVFRSLDYGPHPGIVSCLNSRAMALTNLERFDEARVVYRELLDAEGKLTGETSARFASCLSNSSKVELRTGHTAEAIAILERACEIFAKAAPPTHAHAVNCRNMLGQAYLRSARWSDALRIFDELAPMLDAASGPASWVALANHVHIALCREAQSDATGAETELTPALERALQANAVEDDAWEAAACAHLARLIAQRGEFAEAKELVKRARELRGDSELSKSASAAWIKLAAGVIARGEGDVELARAELEPLAALERGPQNGESAPALARAHLAAVLAAIEPDRARELADRARAELERELGAEHPETRAIASR